MWQLELSVLIEVPMRAGVERHGDAAVDLTEYEVLGGRSYSVGRGFRSLCPRYKLLHTSSSAFTV